MKRPSTTTTFGILNLVVAAEAIYPGVVFLPWAKSYRVSHESSFDALFLLEIAGRWLVIVTLIIGGVGLLRQKGWGWSISVAAAGIAIALNLLLGYVSYATYDFTPALSHVVPGIVYPVILVYARTRPTMLAQFPPRKSEEGVASRTQSTENDEQNQFTLARLMQIVAAIAVVITPIAWWTNHPVERDVFKLR